MNLNRRTPLSAILGAGVLGAVLAGGYGLGVRRLGWAAQQITWGPAILLICLTICVAGLAIWTHHRVQTQRQPLAANSAIWLVSIGKTALLAGAGMAFGYATVAGFAIPGFWAEIPGPTQRLWESGTAAGAAVTLAVAGWFLEGACVLPPKDDEALAAAC